MMDPMIGTPSVAPCPLIQPSLLPYKLSLERVYLCWGRGGCHSLIKILHFITFLGEKIRMKQQDMYGVKMLYVIPPVP